MIVVRFLNTLVGGTTVRTRTFADEGAYVQWVDSVRGLVEIISVSRVAA